MSPNEAVQICHLLSQFKDVQVSHQLLQKTSNMPPSLPESVSDVKL